MHASLPSFLKRCFFNTSNNAKRPDEVGDYTSFIEASSELVELRDMNSQKTIMANLIRRFIDECHARGNLQLIWDGNNHIDKSKLKKFLKNQKGIDSSLENLVQSFIITKQVKHLPFSNIHKKMIIKIFDKGDSQTEHYDEKQLSEFEYFMRNPTGDETILLKYDDIPIFSEPKVLHFNMNSSYTAMLIILERDYNQDVENSVILDQYIREALKFLNNSKIKHSAYDLVDLMIAATWQESELSGDISEVRLRNCIYNLIKRSADRLGIGFWKALAFSYIYHCRKNIDELFDGNGTFISDKFYGWVKNNYKDSTMGNYYVKSDVCNISLSKDKKTIMLGDDCYTEIKIDNSRLEVLENEELSQELEATNKFCEYILNYYNTIHQLFDRNGVFNNQTTEFNDWLMKVCADQLEIAKFRAYSENIKIIESTSGKSIIKFGKYIKIEFIMTEEIVKKYFNSFNRDKWFQADYIHLAPTLYPYDIKDDQGNNSIKYIEMAANQLMVDFGYSKKKLTIKSALLKEQEEQDPISKIFLGLSKALVKYNTLNDKRFGSYLNNWSKNNESWEYLTHNFADCYTNLTPKKLNTIDEYMNSTDLLFFIIECDIKKSWLSRHKYEFLDVSNAQDSDAEEFLREYKDILLQVNKPNQLRISDPNIKYNLNPEDDYSRWVDLGKASGRSHNKGEMRGYKFLGSFTQYLKVNPSSNLYRFLTAKNYPEIVDIITSPFVMRGCEFWIENFEKYFAKLENEHIHHIGRYLMITKFILNIMESVPNFQEAKNNYLTFLTLAFEECQIKRTNEFVIIWGNQVSDWESFIIRKCFPPTSRSAIIDEEQSFNNFGIRKKVFQQLSRQQRISLIDKMYTACGKDSNLQPHLKDYRYVEDEYQSIKKDAPSEDDYSSHAKRIKYGNQIDKVITICDDDFNQKDPVLWFQTNLLPKLFNKVDDDNDKKDDCFISELEVVNDDVLQIFRKAVRTIFLTDYADNGFQYNANTMSALVNVIVNSSQYYEKLGSLVDDYVNAVLNLTLYKSHKDRNYIQPINKIIALEKFSEYCCNAMNKDEAYRNKVVEKIFIVMNKSRKADRVKEELDARVNEELDALVKDNVFTHLTEKRNFLSSAKMPTGAYFALATLYLCDQGIKALNPPSFKFPVAAFKYWLLTHSDKSFEIDDNLTYLEDRIKIIQINLVKYQVKFDSTNSAIGNRGINYADIPALYIVLLDDLIIHEVSAYGCPETLFDCHEMAHRIMRFSFGQKIPVKYIENYPIKFNQLIFTYREDMLFDDDIRIALYNTILNGIKGQRKLVLTQTSQVYSEDEVKTME